MLHIDINYVLQYFEVFEELQEYCLFDVEDYVLDGWYPSIEQMLIYDYGSQEWSLP